MDKRAIQELLIINAGDEEQKVRANIIEALGLILQGIEAKQVPAGARTSIGCHLDRISCFPLLPRVGKGC